MQRSTTLGGCGGKEVGGLISVIYPVGAPTYIYIHVRPCTCARIYDHGRPEIVRPLISHRRTLPRSVSSTREKSPSDDCARRRTICYAVWQAYNARVIDDDYTDINRCGGAPALNSSTETIHDSLSQQQRANATVSNAAFIEEVYDNRFWKIKISLHASVQL